MSFQSQAEDITQDVFMKLWIKREGLHKYNNIEAFVMTVTRNLCLDLLKSKQNKLSNFESTGIKETYDFNTPLSETQYSDQLNWVNKIIADLPELQKTTVQLRDIEGYEYDQIAEITGMSKGAIRTNLSRGRQKIRTELTKVYNYGVE